MWATPERRRGRVRFPEAFGPSGSGSRPVEAVEIALPALPLRLQGRFLPLSPARDAWLRRAGQGSLPTRNAEEPENLTHAKAIAYG